MCLRWNITQPYGKNEIMPFATTWMDPEMIIPSELSQTETERYFYDMTSMWDPKYETNAFIYKTETDAQTEKINLWLLKGRERAG